MPTTDQGETGETGKIAVEKPDARAVLNGKRSQVDISYQLAPGGPHRSEADREPPGAADRDREPHLISIEPVSNVFPRTPRHVRVHGDARKPAWFFATRFKTSVSGVAAREPPLSGAAGHHG